MVEIKTEVSTDVLNLSFIQFEVQCIWQTDRLQAFDSVWEVSHEGESVYSLSQTSNLPKAQHKLVLVRELVQRATVLLVVKQELLLKVGWYEGLKQFQEVNGQSLLVVPVQNDSDPLDVRKRAHKKMKMQEYIRLYGGTYGGRVHSSLA